MENSFNLYAVTMVEIIAAWRNANIVGGNMVLDESTDQFVTSMEMMKDQAFGDILMDEARIAGGDAVFIADFFVSLCKEEQDKWWANREKSEDDEIPF